MKTIKGKVLSTKMKNTVVVEVVRFIEHPLYHKRIRRTKNYHAHCEISVATGETVKIVPIRPMSKTKFWKVLEVIK